MAVEITMPQLSDTMHEGTILNWLKKEGDAIRRGDALAEVATDKADLEIEAFHEGTLLKIFAPIGTTVKVGSIIAVIGEQGQAVGDLSSGAQAAPKAAPVAATPAAPQAVAPTNINGHTAPQSDETGLEEGRIKISPLAKNLASSVGVDYRTLAGSGEGGRIVKRDVEHAAGRELAWPADAMPTGGLTGVVASPPPAARPAVISANVATPNTVAFQPAPQAATAQPARLDGGKSVEPLSRMRTTIAARMVESTTTIPHFYVTAKVLVEGLSKLRTSLKPLPQYEGLTYNHLLIRAAALALRVVPRINAAYVQGNLVQPQDVNVGIVTAVPDGLLIPVLKRADELPLADIVAEGRGLVQRARNGRPKPEDLIGGTFSISNMGIFDVESFTAIISPGQGAILAVSPIQEEPVVIEGQVRVGSVMRLTLSVDHRIIDGVMAGEFLTEIKRLLQDPVLLLA